jgi:hypothetical protein
MNRFVWACSLLVCVAMNAPEAATLDVDVTGTVEGLRPNIGASSIDTAIVGAQAINGLAFDWNLELDTSTQTVLNDLLGIGSDAGITYQIATSGSGVGVKFLSDGFQVVGYPSGPSVTDATTGVVYTLPPDANIFSLDFQGPMPADGSLPSDLTGFLPASGETFSGPSQFMYGVLDLNITAASANGVQFYSAPAPVPLPASAWLLLGGFGGLGFLGRTRRLSID